MKKLILLFISFVLFTEVSAQGIKGTVTADGEALPFATIFIEELGTGTSSNIEGYYEYRLKPGRYRLLFRYLGFQSVTKVVEVTNSFEEINVTLETNVIQLREVEVTARKEDPSYTVIRKAIAKSKYHTLQLDAYTAQVYIKGGGRVKKIPFYLKKTMKKEGVDTSTVYLTESISNLSYKRPNIYEEEVISIRQVGEDNSTSPNGFIQGSFYEPELAGIVSPLSPRAFAYYRFKHEGTFFDGEHEVNKIKVIPRVRGEDVFTGEIYIVEDLWSIHSANFYTYKLGFKITIEQIYAPIESDVWLPISHKIGADGSILGIGLIYDYLATLSDYKITLNSDLEVEELVVIDEKIEKEIAKEIKENSEGFLNKDVEEVFDDKKKFTRKELRKTLKKYEAEMLEEAEEYEEDTTTYNYNAIKIDSAAYVKDSSYWATVRPVPLTSLEQTSYKKLDSVAIAEKEKRELAKSDTTKKITTKGKKGKFNLDPLLFGKTFKLGKEKNTQIKYTSPLWLAQFNTVEGWYSELPILLTHQKSKSVKRLSLETRFRYGFARERLNTRGKLRYQYKRAAEDGTFEIEGGRYVRQFGNPDPINTYINTIWSVLGERNYLKLFEQDYIKATLSQKITAGLKIKPYVEWAERREVFNNSDYSLIDVDERQYTPNAPFNRDVATTSFPTHKAFTAGVQIEYLPLIRCRLIKGKKRLVTDNSPIVRFKYNKGIPGIASSVVDFDHLELGVQHQFKVGARGRLDFNLYGGVFPNTAQLYFMDFQHFPGNQTFLQTSDPVRSFRLLDYYEFSTLDRYAAGHVYYQFRKFLITQIFEARLMGLKENLILNYLNTNNSQNYTEVGYSLDNIFRFFRIEAVAAFEDGKYQNWGIRVGISTNLDEWVSFE